MASWKRQVGDRWHSFSPTERCLVVLMSPVWIAIVLCGLAVAVPVYGAVLGFELITGNCSGSN